MVTLRPTVYAGMTLCVFWGMVGGCSPSWVSPTRSEAGPSLAYSVDGMILGGPAMGPDGTLYVSVFEGRLTAITANGLLPKWEIPMGERASVAPAVGKDGTIYADADEHRLLAMNPDGTKKWEITVEGDPIVGILGGMDSLVPVFCGKRDSQTQTISGKVYGIGTDSEKKWEVPVDTWRGWAVSPDQTIYVRTDDRIAGYDATGNTKTEIQVGRGETAAAGPAIGPDGTIYVTQDRTLRAFGPDGTEKWAAGRETFLFSVAAGSDGTIYAGGGERLYAFHADGTEKWVATLKRGDSESLGLSVGTDGTVVVLRSGMRFTGAIIDISYPVMTLCALNSDGSERWYWETSGFIGGPVVGSDGTVYGASGSQLFAIFRSGPVSSTP